MGKNTNTFKTLQGYLRSIKEVLKEGIGGKTVTASATPTLDTDAYTAADAVGGLLTFSDLFPNSAKSGSILTAILVDDDAQEAETELWLFSQPDFTATADDAAFNPSDADLENLVGVIHFETTDYFSGNNNSAAVKANVGLAINSGATNLYGQLVTRGTPTYAADGLTVKLTALVD